MKNYTAYVNIYADCLPEIKGDLLVATFHHSDKSKLMEITKRFIDNDHQGNFLDYLTQNDFFVTVTDENL